MSISLRHYFYKCYTCGLRIRTAVVIAIYKKSLVLSLKERHAHGGPGEIANLVGIDAQKVSGHSNLKETIPNRLVYLT